MAPLLGAILIVAACVAGDPHNKFENFAPWLFGLGVAMLFWPVLRAIGRSMERVWVDGARQQSQPMATEESDASVKSTNQV